MGVIPFLAACHACVLMLYCIGAIVRYDCSFEWQIKFSLSLSLNERICDATKQKEAKTIAVINTSVMSIEFDEYWRLTVINGLLVLLKKLLQ